MPSRERMRPGGAVRRGAGRWLGAVAWLLLAAALAGCVGIPTSGAVRSGGQITDEDPTPSVLLIPQSPEPGATQESILLGFIRAGVGPDGNYSVAREFLTDDLAATWNPHAAATLMQAGSESVVKVDDTTLEFAMTPIATVDSQGRFRQVTGGSSSTLAFEFEQVDGEWRIASAPDGIVITGSAFEQVFEEHALYYYDPTLDYLVPDLRYFVAPNLSVRLAIALLAGPSDWLRPGVRSEFPEGTELGAGTVQVDDGQAIVDLTAEAADAGASALGRMRVQLEHSLSGVSGITSVALTIEQREVPVDPQQAEPIVEPAVDNRALMARDGRFGYLLGGELEPVRVSAEVERLEANSVTYDVAQERAAVRAGGAVYLVDGDAEARRLDTRLDLAEPSLDNQGHVWSVPTGSPAAIHAINSEGMHYEVANELPRTGRVRAMEVSRDGARIALLLESDGAVRLYVAAIERDEGVPVALSTPLQLPLGSGTPLDASWADSHHIATVARDGEEYTVSLHTVGGMVRSLGTLPTATALVGGDGVDNLRVLGAGGIVYQSRGTGWQTTAVSAQLLATQR